MNSLVVVFGNQLFPLSFYDRLPSKHLFMAEDRELCTYYKFHKHKLILFLSAMRHFADEAKNSGFKVTYRPLEQTITSNESYTQRLAQYIQTHQIHHLHCFEIEDKFMESRLTQLCAQSGVQLTIHRSPLFVVTRNDFQTYLRSHKRPFMKTFYEELRQKHRVLVDSNLNPLGGKYSFDQENRLRLPKDLIPPPPQPYLPDDLDRQVMDLVDVHFADHPGNSSDFWIPTNRAAAKLWWLDFMNHRLEQFGPYEDALSPQHPFVFHSVLSPLMNLGLLVPADILSSLLSHYQSKNLPLASVEGFVRQVLGWREFVRGIYQNFSEREEQTNFFDHQNLLTEHWYQATTQIPPLDDAIKKTIRYGYNHHIERLMVICNMMNLCQIHPTEVHRWFMEMYVDSSDWVMGPNVYGMGLFSDGGIFATKPYICGSNYWLKMSHYPKGDWCEIVDGLYWRFIDSHRKYFSTNPRLSMMVKSYDKMTGEKKERLQRAVASAQYLIKPSPKA